MHSIVFSGELVAGFEPDEVRANLAKLFNLSDPARVESLFSGKPVTLKKNLDAEAARKYEAVLSRHGALCRVEPPLHAFTDEDEGEPEQDGLATQGASVSFNTVIMAMQAADAEAAASAPAADTTRGWRRGHKLALVGGLVLLGLLIWYSLGVFETIRRSEQLQAAGAADDEAFEESLQQTDDAQTRQTMQDLRALMQEAELEAQRYEERDAAAAGN